MTILLLLLAAADPAEAEVQRIGERLRCPVCQGMPIADSPADMARSMMDRVRALVRDGKSEDEIYAVFTAAYGDWVLLQPKAQGLGWGVWLLPPAALAIAALLVVRTLRRAP
jgi:cytochrome c-type biogenesis protein CcmH